IQWDNSKNSGFTKGISWIEIGKNKEINVENALKDKNSVFYHYKKLIELRHKENIISEGSFEIILKYNKKIFSYIREYKNEKLLVINNFYGEECNFELPYEKLNLLEYNSKILISNYDNPSKNFEFIKLRPYESIVYKLVK
ncbi:alpha-glucosidase C-terminal domain-containing protein, partial [Clostridium thermobutyricum]